MNPITWPRPSSLVSSPEYKANSRLARESASRGLSEIISKYTYVGPAEIKDVLELSSKIRSKIRGRGIDLGGGVGCVSAAIAQIPEVSDIICLELVEECVTSCHPKVFENLDSSQNRKISSVIGDFDNLQLEDESIDFAIMWDSFHHSQSPDLTLREARRVLKPGGSLIIVDRAHNNSVTDEQISSWLEVKYDIDFLKANFLEEFDGLTRRMNGEHEYRFFELEDFFKNAGFEISTALGVRFSHSEPVNDSGYQEIVHMVDLGGYIKKKFIFCLSRL